jgi:hypothetical protein
MTIKSLQWQKCSKKPMAEMLTKTPPQNLPNPGKAMKQPPPTETVTVPLEEKNPNPTPI